MYQFDRDVAEGDAADGVRYIPSASRAGHVRSGPRGPGSSPRCVGPPLGRRAAAAKPARRGVSLPELRAERIFLEHVHVVEAFRRHIALHLDQRIVRPADVGEARDPGRLHVVLLWQRRPGAFVRPSTPPVPGNVSVLMPTVPPSSSVYSGPSPVGAHPGERRALVDHVPAEMPHRGLRLGRGAGWSIPS